MFFTQMCRPYTILGITTPLGRPTHHLQNTHLCSRTTRSRSSAAPSSCPKLWRQAACHRVGADAILCHWEQTHAATPRSAGGSLLMMMSRISSGSRRSMSPACSCKWCKEWVKAEYARARHRASPAGRHARGQAAVRNAPSHARTDSVWRARGTGGLSRTPYRLNQGRLDPMYSDGVAGLSTRLAMQIALRRLVYGRPQTGFLSSWEAPCSAQPRPKDMMCFMKCASGHASVDGVQNMQWT